MKKKILVIAAHPDDEILGCGGTMARHSAEGDEVHVLLLAEGVTSRDERAQLKRREKENEARRRAAHRAGKILGVRSLTLHEFPDNRMDSVHLLDVVKKIEAVKKDLKPEIVYTHHSSDVNIDHRRVHEAVIAACRPLPKDSVRRLLFFEVPSSTEWQMPGSRPCFAPNWFTDISKTLGKKIKALKQYDHEMRPWPHPRSYRGVETLARWRGATAGVDAAEAFVLGRVLERLHH